MNPADPNHPIDREVDRALRDVRFAAGSAAGAAPILAAARSAERRGRGTRRLALGLAALALGGTLLATSAWERAAERAERRARLVEEQRELQRELDNLKALIADRSRVSLGGDERTEYFLDLARLDAATPQDDSNRSDG